MFLFWSYTVWCHYGPPQTPADSSAQYRFFSFSYCQGVSCDFLSVQLGSRLCVVQLSVCTDVCMWNKWEKVPVVPAVSSWLHFYKPIIRLTPTSLPEFKGDRRVYWRWKVQWESIQMQAEPTRSHECKKLNLLNSIDEVVMNKLRLLHCRDVNDIFRELENHYGNEAQIEEIVMELPLRPVVKSHQPWEACAGPQRPQVCWRHAKPTGDQIFRE